MNSEVNAIAGRLSLRPPQRESLEKLASILEEIGFKAFVTKENGRVRYRDVAGALEKISARFSKVEDFERDFVSLCFALATGVGKTRLMGAFIAYLHSVYSVNNFFVLAPNLTIYNKLMSDFSPDKPKYVFKGLSDFSQNPPLLINGENYAQTNWTNAGLFGQVRINIFNISKINSEVRGGKEPKIKRFQEVLGEGYFQYLATLPDLVLLMDESHRYRASAGVRAINELSPALGLELTATPFVETTRGPVAFKNILVDYPLGKAMEDGFVKEPAVVTRRDFDGTMQDKDIERIKLEDGIFLHEQVKIELETFHRNTGEALVKPFVLVIARDTTHASALRELMTNEMFEGRYKDKIIQVDSSQSDDLIIEKLLRVERTDEPTEIVIHVNMLKEGWDVTNLYTIIPLRAASARILIEQSIGRGLRLPYGKRVGVTAVDRLNIVAHDKFQEILDEANRPNSIIRLQTVILDEDDLGRRLRPVVAEPTINALLGLTQTTGLTQQNTISTTEALGEVSLPIPELSPAPVFQTEYEQRIAKEAFREMNRIGRQSGSEAVITQNLLEPDVQRKLVESVQRRLAPVQSALEFNDAQGVASTANIAEVVSKTTQLLVARTISIPRILTVPKDDVKIGFKPFKLGLADLDYTPPAQELVIQHLRTNEQERIGFSPERAREKRLADYLVFALVDYPDVDYLTQADLLYDLAGQVEEHFKNALGKSDEDINNIFIYYQKDIASFIYKQMQAHRFEEATEYETRISHGFVELKPSAYTALDSDPILKVQEPPRSKSEIGRYVYGHFSRCLYPVTKFQSDQERILAGILERESEKWFRPARGQFQLHYRFQHDPKEYQPDFVAELPDRLVMLEVKDATEVADAEVQEKKKAAEQWCEHASRHALAHGGKPWAYFVIPHDRIGSNMSLTNLLR
jgi:type III restriction enzyme